MTKGRWLARFRGQSPARVVPTSDLTIDDIAPAEPFAFSLKALDRECGFIDIEAPDGTLRMITTRIYLVGNVELSSDPVTVIVAVPGRMLPEVIQYLVRAYAHWAEAHSGDDGMLDPEGAEVGD